MSKNIESMTEAEINTYLVENGVNPSTLVDEFQDHVQRRLAFGEDLTEQGRANLQWVVDDIEKYREKKENP